MLCPKCGTENPEESIFCNKCGEKMSAGDNEITEIIPSENLLDRIKPMVTNGNILDRIKAIATNKNNRIKIYAVLALIILAIGATIYFNNPIAKFENDIGGNNYVEAMKIYNQKIKGNTSKEASVRLFIKDEITNIHKAFVDEKIDFNQAKSKLETIQNTGLITADANDIMGKINNLNNSRASFGKAEAFVANKDYINALKEYKNVVADDKNYTKAQEQISSNVAYYKEQVLNNVADLSSKGAYLDAVKVLSDAETVLSNDPQINAQIVAMKKSNEDKLIASQELSVVSARIYKDWIGWDKVEVVVKNNTQKVVKEYTVNWMCFDKDGFPIETGFGSMDYLDKGKATHNIQPGAVFGSGYSWDTNQETGAKTVLACIYNVKYYDDSEWTNPYYKYWEEEYLEKPLH